MSLPLPPKFERIVSFVLDRSLMLKRWCVSVVMVIGAAGCAADGPEPEPATAEANLAVVMPSVAIPPRAVRHADGRVHYSIELRRAALPAVARDATSDTRFAAYHPPAAKQLVRMMERDHGIEATNMASSVALAFSAYLTPTQLAEVRADPRVEKIVVDEYGGEFSSIWADRTIGGETISWGTTAVNNNGGTGTYPVYVLDSGFIGHQDLNVIQSVNPSSTVGHVVGCFQHSTAVAGTIGAKSNGLGARGVAPGTPLISVSILPDENFSNGCLNDLEGTLGSWMASLDWVMAQLMANGKVGIINISSNDNVLFGTNGTVNPYIKNVATPSGTYKGALVVESAGNNLADACAWSYVPTHDAMCAGGVACSADGVIVVGGLNQSDQPVVDLTVASGTTVLGFHNLPEIAGSEHGSDFGPCVDMWAPGEQIFTTWNKNASAMGTAYTTISGTSLAAPHVAGLAAMIMSGANPPATSVALETAVRAKLVSLGNSLMMPTLSGVGSPASGPYAEVYETLDRSGGGAHPVVLPSASANPFTGTTLYTDMPFSLFFGTQAAGSGCTFTRTLEGAGTVVSLVLTSGASGFNDALSQSGWSPGKWDINSAQCRMPTQVVNVVPHGLVTWTQFGTSVMYGEASPSATPQCKIDAFFTANSSIHLGGFPVTETVSSKTYSLPPTSGSYTYTASCNDAGPGPQQATGQIVVVKP